MAYEDATPLITSYAIYAYMAKIAIGEKDAKTGHKSTYNLSDKHPRRTRKGIIVFHHDGYVSVSAMPPLFFKQ